MCPSPGFGEKRSAFSDAGYLRNWGFSVWETWMRERVAVCPAWRSSILRRAAIMLLWLWVEHVFKCELHCLCCSNQSWQLWLMWKAWQACRFILMSCAWLQCHTWAVDGDSYLLRLIFGRRGLCSLSHCLFYTVWSSSSVLFLADFISFLAVFLYGPFTFLPASQLLQAFCFFHSLVFRF